MKLTEHSILNPWNQLPESQQDQLGELLDLYANRLQSGDEKAAEQFLNEHPELSLYMPGHLESVQLLCRASVKLDASFTPSLSEQRGDDDRLRFRHDDHTPAILGDYRLEREIGRGGMGIVYAATQLSLRRSVALKVLPFAAVLDQQQVARFRNEAQAAASLHHPHIVPVYAVGCERGVHYYSMQLIDGQTLEQMIKELSLQASSPGPSKKPAPTPVNVAKDTTLALKSALAGSPKSTAPPAMPAMSGRETSVAAAKLANGTTVATIQNRNFVRSTVELMVCVAEAIDCAHQQGVIHRDIKPSNLLLDSSGKVWVADFGLARCRGANHLTAQGNIMGTALYMSPEQVAGRSYEIDHRTDIYSFGITLYELLTLQHAYTDTNREQLLHSIESKDPISLRQLNPAISVDLETIVFKAIAKRKEDRYRTAGELAEDLRRYLDGRPTLARRPTMVDRAFKWAMRRQRFVITAVSIALLSMIGLITATLMISYQSQLKEQANHRAKLHLDQAHHAVDRFSGLISDQLKTIPETEGLRAELLREAERYYLDFIGYAEQNRLLDPELAKVRYRLGAVYARLGKTSEAEACYEQAIADYQSLAEPRKSDSTTQSDLALCFHHLASLCKQQGRYEAASAHFRQAERLQAPLLDSANVDSRRLHEWAATQSNFAVLLWALGDFDDAERRLLQIQRTLEEHLTDDDADSELRTFAIESRNSRVAILMERDPLQAESLLRENIRELDLLKTVDYQAWASQLAISRNNLATLLGKRGDLSEAIDLMITSIELLNQDSVHRLHDSEARQQLAIAHNNLGQLYWLREPSDLATAEFSKAEAIIREELTTQPSQPDALSRLGGILHNRSVMEQHHGKLDDAMRHVAQAIEFQALAIKKAPLNTIYRRALETHRQQLDHVVAQYNERSAKKQAEHSASLQGETVTGQGGKYDGA